MEANWASYSFADLLLLQGRRLPRSPIVRGLIALDILSSCLDGGFNDDAESVSVHGVSCEGFQVGVVVGGR